MRLPSGPLKAGLLEMLQQQAALAWKSFLNSCLVDGLAVNN